MLIINHSCFSIKRQKKRPRSSCCCCLCDEKTSLPFQFAVQQLCGSSASHFKQVFGEDALDAWPAAPAEPAPSPAPAKQARKAWTTQAQPGRWQLRSQLALPTALPCHKGGTVSTGEKGICIPHPKTLSLSHMSPQSSPIAQDPSTELMMWQSVLEASAAVNVTPRCSWPAARAFTAFLFKVEKGRKSPLEPTFKWRACMIYDRNIITFK